MRPRDRRKHVDGLGGDVGGEHEERDPDDPQRAPFPAAGDSAQLPDATSDATISTSESSPKPASPTERARTAAVITTTEPTTFQASVAYSSRSPRSSNRCAVVAEFPDGVSARRHAQGRSRRA